MERIAPANEASIVGAAILRSPTGEITDTYQPVYGYDDAIERFIAIRRTVVVMAQQKAVGSTAIMGSAS
jgi:hypothetical protein